MLNNIYIYIYIYTICIFLVKVKNISILPENAILVTVDEVLENRSVKKTPTESLIKMAEFVLKNNLFEFNDKVFQQISGTAIGTNFAPLCVCIYRDRVEQSFLETQELKPLLWLRHIEDIFFIWTHGKVELKRFMEKFSNFTPNVSLTYEPSEKSISFFNLIITVSERKLKTTLHIRSTYRAISG